MRVIVIGCGLYNEAHRVIVESTSIGMVESAWV